jgi:hypothetical protein
MVAQAREAGVRARAEGRHDRRGAWPGSRSAPSARPRITAAGVRLAEDVRHVVGAEARVDGHENGADLHDREHRVDPLRAVHHPEGDLVAGRDAELEQPLGGGIDARVDLGERPARALERQRLARAPPCAARSGKLPSVGVSDRSAMVASDHSRLSEGGNDDSAGPYHRAARDKKASAEFFAEIFDLKVAPGDGYFAQVRINDALTLDFSDDPDFGGGFGHHYAFHVSDAEFDAIFRRVKARGHCVWQRARTATPTAGSTTGAAAAASTSKIPPDICWRS